MKRVTKITSLLCATTLAGTTLAMASCAKEVPDTPETLEVFVSKLGYGAEFAEDLLDAFKEQDWVKEKYPNLTIVFEESADRSAIGTRLSAGEGKNTVDLIMSDSISGYVGQDMSGKEYSCDLTDVVYNTTVPGEDIKVIDKLDPAYKDALQFYAYGENSLNANLDWRSYTFNWASGMMGMLYNEELLTKFGYAEPPRTTEEFIEACEKITGDSSSWYGKKFALMWSTGADYSQYLYDIWWGQYEGRENYYNYFNGLTFDGEDYSENSADIFKQVGRREALDEMIDLFTTSNGFRYSKGAATDFKAAQRYFTRGEGVFMFNGDWFEQEMREEVAASDYTIKMMKTPILSAITDKTPTIKTDAKLREVVSKIDAGYATAAAAGLSDVSEADYARILEARSITYSLGPGCLTCVPTYATGKQVAFDFLRFMATDEAQKIYMKATRGASLPFVYDVKEKAPEIYAEFSDIQKSRYEMVYESVHGSNVLPYYNNFPLVKFGSLTTWSGFALSNGTVMSYAQQGTKTGSASAQSAYERDLEYWTTNNSNKWTTCLRQAGYLT